MADEPFRFSGEPYRTLAPPPVRGQAGGGYGGPGLWEILASLTGLGISAAGGALGPPLLGIANLIGQGRTRQQAVARQTQLAGYLQNHPLGSAMMAMAQRGEVPEPLLYQLLRGEFEEQQRKERGARAAKPFEEAARRIQEQTEAAVETPEASISLPTQFERERIPQFRAAAEFAREGEGDPSRMIGLFAPPPPSVLSTLRGGVVEHRPGELRTLREPEPSPEKRQADVLKQAGVTPRDLRTKEGLDRALAALEVERMPTEDLQRRRALLGKEEALATIRAELETQLREVAKTPMPPEVRRAMQFEATRAQSDDVTIATAGLERLSQLNRDIIRVLSRERIAKQSTERLERTAQRVAAAKTTDQKAKIYGVELRSLDGELARMVSRAKDLGLTAKEKAEIEDAIAENQRLQAQYRADLQALESAIPALPGGTLQGPMPPKVPAGGPKGARPDPRQEAEDYLRQRQLPLLR